MPVRSARFRLALLWVSQTARVLADNCLRIFVVLQLAGLGEVQRDSAWPLVTFFLMVPAVFLAPLNGALSNSLPKPAVLAGSAVYCLGVVALFGWLNGPWLACWALVAVGAAVYSPTRSALLPAAADDTQVPLTRINGWIELGAAAAVVVGLVLGVRLHNYRWLSLEAALVSAAVLNLLGFLTAVPVRFSSDVRRAEPARAALAGFFRDTRRVLADPAARATLLGLASLRGLLTALTSALVASVLSPQGYNIDQLIRVGVWVAAGAGLGSFLAGLQRHPRRALGLVPLGATGLFVGLLIPAFGAVPSPGLCVILGTMWGLVNVPLAAAYQASLPADARGNGMAVRNLADYVLIMTASVGMFALAYERVLTVAGQFWLVAALAGAWGVVSWRLAFRQVIEQLLEVLIWPFYRIRGHGPGLDHFPPRGPVVVVANHSSWLDPMWLAKVLPRRLIPMMTSVFYDLPGLRWLMVYVAQAIRVQASTFRREVPELDEAVAALDRGACVVIFPEGAMRRRDDLLLRQFGQGVCLILRARPETPVAVCWIEGGWGSFFSYDHGPPTKNKRMDFWRHVDIAVSMPQCIAPELLKDPRATRKHLMEACLDARRYLGLERLSLEKVKGHQGRAEDEEGVDKPAAGER
jgi:1-acyl-sn-glycerol-3-phosphate acyltransferase